MAGHDLEAIAAGLSCSSPSRGACTRRAQSIYAVEAILEVNERRERIRGLAIESEPPFLRHLCARFRQL